MIEKLNPDHEPETPAADMSPKCSCNCSCPCRCPAGDLASAQSSSFPGQNASGYTGAENIHPVGS